MIKSEIIKKALKNKNGSYIVKGDSEELELWSRIDNITDDIELHYIADKIDSVSIKKITGYDFLEDLCEELKFLEYIIYQCENVKSNSMEYNYTSNRPASLEHADYLEYNAEKYREIEIKRQPYINGNGMLRIQVKLEPLKKIYSRLSFANGGKRMETTVTNKIDVNKSNVLVGENIQIENSFNNSKISNIPQNIIDEINSMKSELLKIGFSEKEINNLIESPTKEKINNFNTKLLPYLSNFTSFVTIVTDLATLIN